jgi:hypothetical protein
MASWHTVARKCAPSTGIRIGRIWSHLLQESLFVAMSLVHTLFSGRKDTTMSWHVRNGRDNPSRAQQNDDGPPSAARKKLKLRSIKAKQAQNNSRHNFVNKYKHNACCNLFDNFGFGFVGCFFGGLCS